MRKWVERLRVLGVLDFFTENLDVVSKITLDLLVSLK